MNESILLSRQQMKNVLGGKAQTFACTETYSNGTTATVYITAANVDAAQGWGDHLAWENPKSAGIDCPGAE